MLPTVSTSHQPAKRQICALNGSACEQIGPHSQIYPILRMHVLIPRLVQFLDSDTQLESIRK